MFYKHSIHDTRISKRSERTWALITRVERPSYISFLRTGAVLRKRWYPPALFERISGTGRTLSVLVAGLESDIYATMPKVLVVDDEPDVCFIISSILKNNGFESRESHSIGNCLSLLENYRPDFIIMDIDLPDGSGLEALSKIKARYPEIKVVMNSALNTVENQQQAEQNGAYAFLSKPLNKKRLLDALN